MATQETAYDASPGSSTTFSTTRLSILDTVMVGKGSTPQAALKASISLAQRAENLGFARYWLAEHHGVPAVASSAPVVSIGALAAATNRIRVGSGGVMLPNHVPLIVAEQFGTLEALYPGRIDLGVGRARPNARITSVLSRYLTRYGIDDFQEQITELVGFLTGNFPTDHPYSELIVSPQSEKPPTMWMLGDREGVFSRNYRPFWHEALYETPANRKDCLQQNCPISRIDVIENSRREPRRAKCGLSR